MILWYQFLILLFDKYDNADEVIEDYCFIGRRWSDSVELNDIIDYFFSIKTIWEYKATSITKIQSP